MIDASNSKIKNLKNLTSKKIEKYKITKKKIILDIFISSLILILISPLLLIISIAIKIDSKGPVIYKQRRHGLNNKEITIYKFRSMKWIENENKIKQATHEDVRVTKLGRILRNSSLDELPQFINVLQGRMSIVGPRPHAITHNNHYKKYIDCYMERHQIKPGITGWAQINGYRGETEKIDTMQSRINFDMYYINNWSLKFDILIILKTIIVIFRDKRAY